MRHYDTQTQLAYGNIDMHELGRDLGPLFTMLTKWPVSVAGDVYKKVALEGRKGAGDAFKKYMAPLGVAIALDSMRGDEGEALIGSRGFTGWMPVNSIMGNPLNLFAPVPALTGGIEFGTDLVEHGIKELKGSATDSDRRGLTKKSEKVLRQYAPVAGSLLNLDKRIERFTDDK